VTFTLPQELRTLAFGPHVHLLVTAGGLSEDGTQSVAAKHRKFLVPVRALSVIVRAKVCAGLRRAGLLDHVPSRVWTTPWVVHAQPAGQGQRVLEYLGRYVFRIAITNSRLEDITADHVTFRYRDNRTQAIRRVTITGVEFLERFLEHVLPRSCAKVRYYGLWSARHRADRTTARTLLSADTIATPAEPTPAATPSTSPSPPPPRCPHCQTGHLLLIATLPRQRKVPP
jgi:hypothetical protein